MTNTHSKLIYTSTYVTNTLNKCETTRTDLFKDNPIPVGYLFQPKTCVAASLLTTTVRRQMTLCYSDRLRTETFPCIPSARMNLLPRKYNSTKGTPETIHVANTTPKYTWKSNQTLSTEFNSDHIPRQSDAYIVTVNATILSTTQSLLLSTSIRCSRSDTL